MHYIIYIPLYSAWRWFLRADICYCKLLEMLIKIVLNPIYVILILRHNGDALSKKMLYQLDLNSKFRSVAMFASTDLQKIFTHNIYVWPRPARTIHRIHPVSTAQQFSVTYLNDWKRKKMRPPCCYFILIKKWHKYFAHNIEGVTGGKDQTSGGCSLC